jgi:hypothetical protein
LSALPVVTSPEERAALIKARSDVLALIGATDTMLGRCITEQASTSEVDTCLLKNPEGWWLTYSHSSLFVAADHLSALLAIWAAPAIPHSAGYTVIRGAAEAAARACWFVDPSLASRERIARGIVERAYDLGQMRRFVGETEQVRQGRTVFDTTIARAGFALDRGTCENQKRPGPGVTSLMHWLLSAPITSGSTGTIGGLTYALLSGYAHAETWATLMDVERVDPRMGVLALNIPRQIQLLRLAMRLLHTGVCWTVQLAGLDVDAWKNHAVPLVLGT